MSRIFSFSSFGFFLGLLVWGTATANTSWAKQKSSEHWTPAPPVPSQMDSCGQPFLSLLDDVTIQNPRDENFFSIVARCELNAPNDSDPKTTSTCSVHCAASKAKIDDELEWATLLTYSCDDKTCSDCPPLVFTNSPPSYGRLSCLGGVGSGTGSSKTSACDTDNYPQSAGDSILDQSESYCGQVSKLLATTINSSQASFEAKSEAIELAMQMVADKTRADAELKINEIKAVHQKQIVQLQNQLLAAKDSQMHQLITKDEEPQGQHLTNLGHPFCCGDATSIEKPTPVFDRSRIPSSSSRLASKMLADNRANEIVKLKQEIDLINARLNRLVNRPVRPATHLEPVYVPQKELLPIRDTPERHSYRRLEPSPPLKRLR